MSEESTNWQQQGSVLGKIQEMFFFQAEAGIRVLVRSRGLGDVYKGQVRDHLCGQFAHGPGSGRHTG